MTQALETLLPCPWCDGEGWLHRVPGGAIWPCWQHTPDCPSRGDKHYLTDADAIAAGNTRKPCDAGLREALGPLVAKLAKLEDDVRAYSGNEASGYAEIARLKAQIADEAIAALSKGDATR